MATRLLLTGDGTTRSGRCWIECGVLEEHANSRLMNIKPYCSTKALVTSRKKKFLPQRTPNPSQTRLGPALTQPPPHSKSPVPNQQPATTRERQAKSEGTKKKKKTHIPIYKHPPNCPLIQAHQKIRALPGCNSLNVPGWVLSNVPAVDRTDSCTESSPYDYCLPSQARTLLSVCAEICFRSGSDANGAVDFEAVLRARRRLQGYGEVDGW